METLTLTAALADRPSVIHTLTVYISAVWPYMAFAGVFLFILYLYERGNWRD